MLAPEEWEKIGKKAGNLYASLELEIIEEIAERIANVGYANTVVMNDIIIAEQMGLLYDDIISLVAKYNETNEDEIRAIFEQTGIKSIAYDDKIYIQQGLSPRALKQSASMWQFLEASARNTNMTLENLTRTTAFTSQTEFYNQLQKAYLEVSTGIKSYNQSITDIVKNMGDVMIQYPSGRQMNIESATRMNILTSVNQMCGKLQLMRAEEMGNDLMEITAHIGARPEHAEWQGKIVSLSGKKGYLSLKDIGYGEVTGFKGVNCRHDWLPYYEGMTRTYDNKELDDFKNKTIKYNNKEIPVYEATQMLNKMNRTIKKEKKEIAGLKGISNVIDVKQELAEKQMKLKLHRSIKNNFEDILNKAL